MTTNYHTAISVGAAANAATFNSPMGELDAAIGDILDGCTFTGTIGFSAAGTIKLVNSATGLKIVDASSDELIVANTLPVWSSDVGSATTGTPRLFLGTNTSSGDDSGILLGRNVTGNSLFSHGFRDESTFDSGPADSAYCSFDAIPTITEASNHCAGFQARPEYDGTAGTLAAMRGFVSYPTVTSGTVTDMYAIHIFDPLGAGTITNNYGLYIEELDRGGTANFAIFTVGATPSYHAGRWQTGADIIAGTTVTGTNLWVTSAPNSVGVGLDQSDDAYLSTQAGHAAGHSLTEDSSNCTFIGAYAGYSATDADYSTYIGALAGRAGNGNGNVFVGYSAGRYETGSNTFMVDNQDRSDEATGRTNSLIIGTMAATTADQKLTVNGRLGVEVASPAAKLHVDQTSTTAAIPVLTLDQADVSEPFIKLIGESTTDNTQSLIDAADLEDAGAIVGWFKVYIEDVQGTNPITDGVYWVPFYETPTHSA